jgi:hypothetical protein
LSGKRKEKKNLAMGPKGVPDTKTYWLTVSSKVTSTSNAGYVPGILSVKKGLELWLRTGNWEGS